MIQASGQKELYDLVNDPFELESKHRDPALAPIMNDLAARLERQKGLAMSVFNAPSGVVGRPYRLQLRGWGGQAPYHWRIYQGSLPAGLALNSSAGVISGTPVRAETRTFKILLQDSSIAKQSSKPQYWIEDYTVSIAQ